MNQKEAFWKWFETNHKKYSRFNEIYVQQAEESVALLDSITAEIQKFSKGLFVELSADKDKKELVITAQGNKEYFADAYALVAAAPKIDNWNIIALKPAKGLDFNFTMAEVNINPDEILFMPLEAEEYPHDVAVRLYHKDYTTEEGAKRNAVIVGLYTALNLFLGEKRTALDFQYIDFDDMPHPKEQTFAFAELKGYIDYKKSQRPYAGQEFPPEDIKLLEGKIGELPELLVLNRALKFYEFTEQYPYRLEMVLEIKNVGEKGLPTGNTDELYRIEDIVYQGIAKAKKGHFIATQTHNGKRNVYYYANSKETIERTLGLLDDTYESCSVTSKIEFDPFWVQSEQLLEL